MVPPNQTLILEKIDTVMRCLSRVSEKTPATLHDFENDLDRQDIVILNLERAIQACVDIAAHIVAYSNLPVPSTMSDAFEKLASAQILSRKTADQMKKTIGLRNILVHEYQKIDWTILWQMITGHLDDFHSFVTEIQTATTHPEKSKNP